MWWFNGWYLMTVNDYQVFHLMLITLLPRQAKQWASQILRCFHSRDRDVLCNAFAVYVRPVIEYCSPVWSPCTVTDINRIESGQRTFTKRLSGLRSLPYNECLSLVGLERLELRRIRADLVMCYKIIYGLVHIAFAAFFKFIVLALPLAIRSNYCILFWLQNQRTCSFIPSSYCYIMELFVSCYSTVT